MVLPVVSDGSTAIRKVRAEPGMPVAFGQLAPSFVVLKTPTPGLQLKQKAFSPVPATSVPPFAFDHAIPPITWVGRVSPIDRQLCPLLRLSQTPPSDDDAK